MPAPADSQTVPRLGFSLGTLPTGQGACLLSTFTLSTDPVSLPFFSYLPSSSALLCPTFFSFTCSPFNLIKESVHVNFLGEGGVLPYLFGRGRVRRHGDMFGLLPFLFRRMRWHGLKVKGKKEKGRGKESWGNGIFSAWRLELIPDLSFLNTCLQMLDCWPDSHRWTVLLWRNPKRDTCPALQALCHI